jgi:succinate dehydrogenase hydrophobic anchor subunit
LGEFGLVACVVYHALNGLRIALMDFRPDLWKYQEQAAYYVLGGTVLILIPFFAKMGLDAIDHYSHDPEVLSLFEVIWAQRIFLVYFFIGGVAALVIAYIQNSMSESDDAGKVKVGTGGSSIEKFWWSFMRISGVLIVPLVFGHLAMMHVLQGVFEITAVRYNSVVGVPAGTWEMGAVVIGNGVNDSRTAVEFVAERWNYLWAGVAIWKWYDVALLTLVVMHGFNGLRLVLTDYTMDNPLLRRTVTNLCLIGGIALLLVGALALLNTIDQEAINLAIEATTKLYGGG